MSTHLGRCMSRSRRLLLLIVALSVALVVGCMNAGSAGAADPGFTLTRPNTTGINPAGVVVRVLVSSQSAPALYTATQTVSAEMRSAGLDLQFTGLRLETGTGITVSAGSVGCGPGALGNTWPRYGAAYDGRTFQGGAYVEICPSTIALGGWTLIETVRHEMGHAVGLAHTASTLGGRHQTMYPAASPADVTYGVGDWNGLRAIAALTRAARVSWPAIGHVDAAVGGPGTQVTVAGWVLPTFAPGVRAWLFLYDNGRLRSATMTTVNRPDVNRVYDPTTTVAHGFDVSFAGVAGANQVCVQVSTTTSGRSTLGCWNMVLAA